VAIIFEGLILLVGIFLAKFVDFLGQDFNLVVPEEIT
jgi:hypothetical protein